MTPQSTKPAAPLGSNMATTNGRLNPAASMNSGVSGGKDQSTQPAAPDPWAASRMYAGMNPGHAPLGSAMPMGVPANAGAGNGGTVQTQPGAPSGMDKMGGAQPIPAQTGPLADTGGSQSDLAAMARGALGGQAQPTPQQPPPSQGAPMDQGGQQPNQGGQPLQTNFPQPGGGFDYSAGLGDPSQINSMMQQARDAAYRQAQGYLDPQWQNQQRDEQTRLANQGVSQNSDAWNRAMDDFNRQRTFAYGQAEQGAYGQGLQAQGQMADQLLQQLGFRTQEHVAGIGANAQLSAANNALNAQREQNQFNNSLSLRNQDINELLMQQQNPLQMFNSLTQGNGVQSPNFTSAPGANVGGTDIASIFQQAMGQRNNVYNAQTGAANSANTGMATILAAILSDRRAKTDIEKVGKTDDGLPVYTYRYRGSPTTQMGVMAQDVEKKKPEAVVEHPSGYKMVDYGKL